VTLQPPRLLTAEGARALHAMTGAETAPGLTERELDGVEERYGFRFAADHRVFLAAGLPLGGPWPDWRGGDPAQLRGMLDWPVEGTLFDVEHNSFWHPRWGVRPEATAERLDVARVRLADVPQLVPVYGHRYLPGTPGQFGHPVLSVHQTDIIYYGADLADYVRHEFTGLPAQLDSARSTVDFWSYVLGENNGADPTFTCTTPHDQYATDAGEALAHLRMLALERRLGRHVDDATLIATALTALVLDVDTPALRLLAGLSRAEEARAADLFVQVLDELGPAVDLPADEAEIRWELTRWWLELVVGGTVHPALGADLVAQEAWAALGHPQPLLRISAEGVRHEEWTPEAGGTREAVAAAIVAEARRLLAGPWPPIS
jgi:hypothetical protein